MVLYLVGILVALAIAAMLWQQRKTSNDWQRQFTFFVDLLALSATALVVGVLAMVQLASPPAATSESQGLVSAPAGATVEPLPEGDFASPESATRTVPADDTVDATATRRPTRTVEAEPTTPSASSTATARTTATVRASPTVRRSRTPAATATARETATPEPTETAPATPTVAPTPTVGNRVYRVQEGDTLIEIAERFDVSANAILAANPGMSADSLRIGQELIIPPPGSDAPPPAAPAPTTTTYTVREGDTLGSIAANLGTTVATLERLNPGLNPTRLRIGQVLIVPR